MADPYNPYDSPYGSQAPYPSVEYGSGYRPQFTGTARTSPGNQLFWAVLVLGLATYVLSYAVVLQPGSAGWAVRFSTLAAIVAALSLLPRQNAHTKLMVAFSVMGFLEALSWSITGNEHSGWATIVIVVLIALQALTAVAAQLTVPDAAESGTSAYDAYAYYAQATQQYYASNTQHLQQQPVQGQATAQAEAAATAQPQQSTADRYGLYAKYLDAQSSRNPAASSPSGRTQTAQPAAGTGMPTNGPTNRVRPRNDPPTGSTSQSWPS
jgi:uncharacterized protein DUF5336